MRLSISTRLTIWYGLTLLMLLSLFAVFSYVAFHEGVHQDFDQHLAHERRMLAPFIRVEGEHPSIGPLNQLRSVAYRTDGTYGTYVRLLSTEGEVLYASPNFEHHGSLPVQLPPTAHEVSSSRTWEGNPIRSHYTPLSSDDGTLRGWLEVSGFEWSMHQELNRLGEAFVIGIFLSVMLAMGGGYLLACRALKPVSTLTDTAHEIGASNLSARLPTRFGVRDELTDLAETFNHMLDRLEKSLQRERRFTSNAAHELLTPLTTMRNGVEIALRRERTPVAYQKKLQTILLDIDDLVDTVRGLLQLSRVERLQDRSHEPVELRDVCREHVRRFHDRAAAREVKLSFSGHDEVYVLGDKVRLGEVVDNLIDNALKYTPEGGYVRVQVDKQGEDARLLVTDSGVGFSPDAADQLFDRFYRADTTDVQAQSGSGLGLSIVQAIVQVYGGTVTARSEGLYQGSTFEVRLPSIEASQFAERIEEPSPSPA